jgi:hypothetical protein
VQAATARLSRAHFQTPRNKAKKPASSFALSLLEKKERRENPLLFIKTSHYASEGAFSHA